MIPMAYNNYDKETLRKIQKIELMILKDFIKICEDNDLEYFLYGGSALGAIRHDGFIPWDDDIDVIMFRKDYEKFLKIMKNMNLKKYELLTPYDYDDYCWLYSKISLKNTKFNLWWRKQVKFNLGIFIDIFVLDNLSDNKFKRKLQTIRGRLLERLSIMSTIKLENYPKLTQGLSNIMHRVLKFLNISSNFFNKRALKILKKYENENTEFVCDISAGGHPQVYKREDYIPAKKTKFEDIEVNIPNNYDKVLTNIYGDYMQLPPEGERENHIPKDLNLGPYE